MERRATNMNNLTLSAMPEILTAKDISQYLGIHYNTALSLIKYKLVYIKIGSSYRVTKTHFMEFLESSEPQEFSFRKNA